MPEPRREAFNEVAETYSRARPAYPAEMVDDLVSLARLRPGARVIEIGPGTGQATQALATHGLDVTGVELGANLAEVARRNLSDFRNVRIVVSSYEQWKPGEANFDAVTAFTAFHWVDAEVRYEKSARLLRNDGILALVGTKHVLLEDDDPFWIEVQKDYDAVTPSDSNGPPPHPDAVADLAEEIEASGYFRNAASRRYVWKMTHDADSYIALLETFSNHRRMEPATRERLYGRIHARIEAAPGGEVTKTLLATLNVARKL